jgi:hypothetical protein
MEEGRLVSTCIPDGANVIAGSRGHYPGAPELNTCKVTKA